MNFKYYIGSLLALPFLPLMYYQGKRIKSSIPKLPEATGVEGSIYSEVTNGKSLRLISIGESTIAGVGVDTHEEGFTGTLVKELSKLLQINIDWKVYARSGYTAKTLSEKIIPEINEVSIGLIIIGLGGNDAFTLNSPRKWKKDVQGLIDKIRLKYSRTPIVFCNMPPIKEFPAFTSLIKFTVGNLVELLGEELKKLVREYDNVFYFGEIITLKKWTKKFNIQGDESAFFSDGVHPSKLTYQVWAKETANRISNNNKLKNTIL